MILFIRALKSARSLTSAQAMAQQPVQQGHLAAARAAWAQAAGGHHRAVWRSRHHLPDRQKATRSTLNHPPAASITLLHPTLDGTAGK
jgi:hypothetical protein